MRWTGTRNPEPGRTPYCLLPGACLLACCLSSSRRSRLGKGNALAPKDLRISSPSRNVPFRSGVFRNFPFRSVTFRNFPFRSVLFRPIPRGSERTSHRLVPGACCPVPAFFPVACCLSRWRCRRQEGVFLRTKPFWRPGNRRQASLPARLAGRRADDRSRKQTHLAKTGEPGTNCQLGSLCPRALAAQRLTYSGPIPKRSASFRNFPFRSGVFRNFPFRSVSFRVVPGGLAGARGRVRVSGLSASAGISGGWAPRRTAAAGEAGRACTADSSRRRMGGC